MSTAAAPRAGPRLRACFDYRRFLVPACRVLLLEPHYYLVAEVERALTGAGHAVVKVAVPRPGTAGDTAGTGDDWLKRVLLAAAGHRPDFVLTINHFGFDDGGALAGLFDELRLPSAVWYVDSPEPILRGSAARNATAHTSLFVWERTLAPRLSAMGFPHVEHLPLAVDAARMQPLDAVPARHTIVFVGDSLAATQMRSGARLSAEQRAAAEPAVAALAADARVGHEELLALAGAADAPGDRRADTLGFVLAGASGRRRQAVLAALPQAQLHVFGDEAWRQLLPRAQCHPVCDYLTETPDVYRRAGVVVNVTSRQMPTAVNQRVFDVPAAGGCLLTDAQGDFAALFDGADECLVYREPDEARARAEWLLAHPDARRRATARLRERLVAEHTYGHRAERLVAAMRARYG
jgi:spore maturation protein CgeB